MGGFLSTCLKTYLILSLIAIILSSSTTNNVNEAKITSDEEVEHLFPTVMIAILVRNKEHVLPWFFGHLEILNYPKDRIALWIRSDHNVDNTSAIIQTWVDNERHHYHSVNVEIDTFTHKYDDQRGPCDWSDLRFDKVIDLRQEALDTARQIWADYLFMLDADVVLEHKDMLSILMNQEVAVIGPMLNSSEGGTYSNFWGGMTEKGYYQRIPQYFNLIDRKQTGLFKVPMVHTAVLINLRMAVSKKFYYKPPPGYSGPKDDIITLAKSVLAAGETMHIINNEFYGVVMVPLEYYNSLRDEADHFTYIKREATDRRSPFRKSPHIYVPEKSADKMGFDEVYMINLLRRPERRQRMVETLKELGIAAKLVDAVDGK